MATLESRISKSKILATLLVGISFTAFNGDTAYAQELPRPGRTITRNGNVFELSVFRKDTQIVINPLTAEEEVSVRDAAPEPVKMNGESIHERVDKVAYFTAQDKDLGAYLIRKLDKELSLLEDGKYEIWIKNIITDTNGRVVYFDCEGIQQQMPRAYFDQRSPKPIYKELKERIDNKLSELISTVPAYIPAQLGGRNVVAYTSANTYERFTVKDHKVKVD